MFCKNCGERLSDNAKFCPACGTTTVEENEMQNDWQGESFVRQGFSEKINDPAILAATKKNNKIAGILGLFLIPLPIIIALILGVVDDDSSYVGYGIFVSIIIIISSLIYYAKMKLGKQWDGVVIAKNTETHSDMDEDSHGATYTYYVIKIKKDRGGIKKIKEREFSRTFYDYLNVGDRVRCHPQFNFYFEKYDKSHDTYAICPVCNIKNPIQNSICSRCGVPVIK